MNFIRNICARRQIFRDIAARNMSSDCMIQNLAELSKQEFKCFFNNLDTILTDCDGVLWLGNDVIKGIPTVFEKFREHGKRIWFVTNNSTKCRDEFTEKLKKLNYSAEKDEVICTSFLAANYLKDMCFNKKVYLIGMEGLATELDAAGIEHTQIGADVMETNWLDFLDTFEIEKDIGAVVVGFDEHFSWPKMSRACTYINKPDTVFVGTNGDDKWERGRRGVIGPLNGAQIKCLEYATKKKAVVLGKPNQYIVDYFVCDQKLDPDRTLMIGDRLSTDICFGNRSGFYTLLVLTGENTLSDVKKCLNSNQDSDREQIPTFYINTLTDLLKFL